MHDLGDAIRNAQFDGPIAGSLERWTPLGIGQVAYPVFRAVRLLKFRNARRFPRSSKLTARNSEDVGGEQAGGV